MGTQLETSKLVLLKLPEEYSIDWRFKVEEGKLWGKSSKFRLPVPFENGEYELYGGLLRHISITSNTPIPKELFMKVQLINESLCSSLLIKRYQILEVWKRHEIRFYPTLSSPLEDWLEDDGFFHIRITIISPYVHPERFSVCNELNRPDELQEIDFEFVLEQRKRTLPVILGSIPERSNILKALIDGGMTTKPSPQAIVEDLDYETLSGLIEYISASVYDRKAFPDSVLQAAKKYNVGEH